MAAPRKKLDLRKTLFLLPNMITLSSIFCGFDSIRLSASATSTEDYYLAALLIIYALFFDILDGRVARLTKTQSAFGLQIDSLADVVSFGVAPALLAYKWSLVQLGTPGIVIAFAFTGAGAVRLARFNVLSMGESGQPTKPGKYIVGLPVPGAAGVLLSLVIANHAIGGDLGSAKYVYVITGLTLFLAFLMVSTVKFRSFKDLKLNGRSIALVLFALGSSAAIALKTKPAFVLVWLLGMYVVIALIETALAVPKGLKQRRQQAASERSSLPPT